MESRPPPDLLVVGGAMRSGTTLLQEILDSHPDVSLPHPELHVLGHAGRSAGRHLLAILRRNHAKLRDPEFPGRGAYLARYAATILRRHGPFARLSLADVHAALAATLPPARHVGDKFPGYLALHPLFANRPATRCIYIHRDGRDVVASLRRRATGKWRRFRWARPYADPEYAARYWLATMDQLDAARATSPNLLVLRYESLVASPSREAARLGAFLGVDPAGFDVSQVRDSSIGRYAAEIPPPDLARITPLLAPRLAALGYA